MIKHALHPILARYLAPAGDDGSDTGGGEIVDRGDDWTPTDDDAEEVVEKEAKPEKKAAKAEGTEEEEAAEEAEETEEEAADKKDKRKDSRIPLARHKEVLEKERAARADLEKRLAKYEGGDRIAAISDDIKSAETKIEALEKEYTKLLTDGEHEKAAAKRSEMRRLENDIIEQKSDLKAAAATSRAVEKMRYDTTVERLESAYPVLNPDHDDHDADRTQDVLDLATTYRARGLTPAEAIQKAARTLLGTETKKQETAVTTKARVDKEEAEAAAAAAAAADKRKETEEARKKAQVKKNVETEGRQPPDTTKQGADHDKAGGGITPKDVMKMSTDDFNKLDEKQLAAMRGDFIGS